METFLKEVDLLSADFVDFSYQRNTVYLRFCHRDYHKGSALGELCRLEGMDPARVLAAGDHYNDIPMLDGRHARHAACPANAIEAVKHRVRLSGGYVADRNYADGIADALAFFERKEAEGFRTTASVGNVM
jgi:hydroxymethylpyrimidine pyrophosphatase-like HAD family hydrolase